VRHCLALIGLLVLCEASGAPRLPPERRVSELLGTWQGVEANSLGRKGRFTAVWEIKEGVIARTTQPGGPAGEWKYSADPTTNPKRIDLFPDTGPGAGRRLPGVYLVKGDQLRICYVGAQADDDHPRPTTVEEGGPDLVLLTFKRKQP
jgi:uncharacterized protein (TIGR03067 family)